MTIEELYALINGFFFNRELPVAVITPLRLSLSAALESGCSQFAISVHGAAISCTSSAIRARNDSSLSR
jgi:hypothetical protein